MTIDEYLARLSRLLTVQPATRDEILLEVRDHLEDASRQLARSGMPERESEAQAVAEFGNVASVALRFNAVHPVYWDRRRFALGLLGGIVATWALWTLLCYPLLVQLAVQRPIVFPGDTAPPWSLLFSATPLGFGMFSALGETRYWIVALFLFLYCLTPFLLGRRAQSGWQPGLAFGLGTVLGFIWLPAVIIAQWPQYQSAAVFVFVGAIGLLAPVAIVAAWVGRLSLAWKPGTVLPGRAGNAIARWMPSRMTPSTAVIVCLGLALVGTSGWSFVRDAQHTTLPPIYQQIQAAQANLSFDLRQPTFLPPSMVLTFVVGSPNRCNKPCDHIYCQNACAVLFYQGAHDASLTITEVAMTPIPLGLPPSEGYQVTQQSSSSGSMGPTWWLGTWVPCCNAITITWVRDGIAFTADSTGTVWSEKVMERIADSLQ